MKTPTPPTLLLAAFLAAGLPLSILAHEPAPAAPTTAVAADDPAHDAKMAWWRDAKFGMFIHWGLYAIPAGAWPGKGTSHAEWIRDTAHIPVAEYDKLLAQFNPVKFNADDWARLAQESGVQALAIHGRE